MTSPPTDRATRLLIVSGEIGEGHAAVARAVASIVARDRPDCDIRLAEAFARMGHGSGPVFRWLFEFAVQWTPVLQEAWYAAVTHSRLVRWFYREVMGAWVARALAADLEGPHARLAAGGAPDVVVSTHQLATAGLAWLRRRGRLDARVVAAICDFAPHAYWTYPGVDEYLVLDDLAAAPTRVMDPGAGVTVRSALVWLGEADPVLSMETTREEDPKLSGQRELFEHWQDHLTEGRFYSVTEVINTACEVYGADGEYMRPQFRDLLMRMTRATSAKPSSNWGKP